MFYLGEIAALLICWLFYCELYWKTERTVLKVCSRQYLDKRCQSLADRLFFTPVSGKAKLGALYYINKYTFFSLTGMTLFHLVLGWNDVLEGAIRALTTVFVVTLGVMAVGNSAASTEQICANNNITSHKITFLLKMISLISELFLILTYLYFAWCYIG